MKRAAADRATRKHNGTTFGAKLDALIGVTGHRLASSHVTGVYLAKRLGINESQFTRKRNGEAPVNEREMCIIIDTFGIGAQVDYRIFLEPDVDAFLSTLKEARVGTYGSNQRYSLSQLLFNASRISKQSVKFSRIIGPFAPRGPLGLAQQGTGHQTTLKIGSRVNIECVGPAEHHLVVLTADRDAKTSVLMPSMFAPETKVSSKRVTLPTSRDFDTFDVTPDPGSHRLYAIWTDEQLASVLHRNFDPAEGVKDMDDRTAMAICKLFTAVPIEKRLVAACDYVVEK